MGLNNFITINLPYCLKRNDKREWIVLNREYAPIGWNSNFVDPKLADNLPLYTNYSYFTDSFLLDLAGSEDMVQRNAKGEIIAVHLYDTETHPLYDSNHQTIYFKKLEMLSRQSVSNV